jgi:hypothetical protein
VQRYHTAYCDSTVDIYNVCFCWTSYTMTTVSGIFRLSPRCQVQHQNCWWFAEPCDLSGLNDFIVLMEHQPPSRLNCSRSIRMCSVS